MGWSMFTSWRRACGIVLSLTRVIVRRHHQAARPGLMFQQTCACDTVGRLAFTRFLSDKTAIGRIKPSISIVFTCNVCETRQAKNMSKKSYQEGVVLIRCDGCDNLHLIADNLGWFEDKKINIVEILKRKEEEVRVMAEVDLLDISDLELVKGTSEKGKGD